VSKKQLLLCLSSQRAVPVPEAGARRAAWGSSRYLVLGARERLAAFAVGLARCASTWSLFRLAFVIFFGFEAHEAPPSSPLPSSFLLFPPPLAQRQRIQENRAAARERRLRMRTPWSFASILWPTEGP